MSRDTCRMVGCDREPDAGRFCSEWCRIKFEDLRDDVPQRSEPADFGGGESIGEQDL